MLLEVEFTLRQSDPVLTLPETALGSGGRIWTADSGNLAREVELPDVILRSGFLVIPEHLGGESFVVEGQHFLNEGSELHILNGIDE